MMIMVFWVLVIGTTTVVEAAVAETTTTTTTTTLPVFTVTWWFSFLSSIVLVWLTTRWFWYKYQQKQLQAMYAVWIRRAQQERDQKQHIVLSSSSKPASSSDNDNDQEDADSSLLFPTVVDTRNAILEGKLDPVDHVVRLAHRCRTIGRPLNIIAEEFYDEAAERARAISSSLQNSTTTTTKSTSSHSALYGVPISMKECFALKGAYCTGGLACRLRERMTRDSLIVQVLREHAGAIPLCTANVMQLMMLTESTNRIWGRACNPWDVQRTPGGSSGGDAALVARRCVPLALASDVAGSIRIPACFCGVVGFKPTSRRYSFQGNMRPRKDNLQGTHLVIPSAMGPIARTVEDCAAFLRATLVPALWNGSRDLPQLPFDENAYNTTVQSRSLRIGYFETDDWFEPCATSKRAVQETIRGLEKRGHTCVPFKPPTDGWANYGLLIAVNSAEGRLQSFVGGLEGEEFMPEYQTLYILSHLPGFARDWLMPLVDRRVANLLDHGRPLNVFSLWKKMGELMRLREQWSTAVQEHNLDALIYPGMPIPAFPHGLSAQLTSCCSYTLLANLLDWPAGTVPVTLVQPDETHYHDEKHPNDVITKLVRDQVMPGSAGLPIGVSVMATGAFRDEVCLAVMKQVEQVVQFRAEPPPLVMRDS